MTVEYSRIAGYRRLREVDPALCQAVVKFSEDLAARYNLDLDMERDIKQALCQFAVDILTRLATEKVLCGARQMKWSV